MVLPHVAKVRTDVMKEQLATFRSQLEEFARKHKVIHSTVFSWMSKEKESLMTIIICLKLQIIRWLLEWWYRFGLPHLLCNYKCKINAIPHGLPGIGRIHEVCKLSILNSSANWMSSSPTNIPSKKHYLCLYVLFASLTRNEMVVL